MKTLQFFRSLLPSWRFFDDVGHVPDLVYRSRAKHGDFTAWRSAFAPIERSAISYLFNSVEVFRYAEQSLVEQLVQEMGDAPDASELTSYRLVRALVENRVAQDAAATQYEFAIVWRTVGQESEPGEEILKSPGYEVTRV